MVINDSPRSYNSPERWDEPFLVLLAPEEREERNTRVVVFRARAACLPWGGAWHWIKVDPERSPAGDTNPAAAGEGSKQAGTERSHPASAPARELGALRGQECGQEGTGGSRLPPSCCSSFRVHPWNYTLY